MGLAGNPVIIRVQVSTRTNGVAVFEHEGEDDFAAHCPGRVGLATQDINKSNKGRRLWFGNGTEFWSDVLGSLKTLRPKL